MSAQMSRRALLTGIGAVGGAVALGSSPAGARSVPASAAPAAQPGLTRGLRPNTAPALPTPLSSAPELGVSYRFVNWHDFAPEDRTTYGRAFAGDGAYTDVTGDYLAAFVDIPPGGIVHDVEFYLSNSAAVDLFGITWVSGTGPYPSPYWLQTMHPANASMHAARFAIPSSLNGPFPFGTRVGVSLLTPTDASVQINGVRFGFTKAPMSTVLLPAPYRVFDTTSSTPLADGQTRTISLASQIPVGANAALYSVNAFNCRGAGVVHVGPAGSSLVTPAVRWARDRDVAINNVTTTFSSSRKLGINCAGASAQADLHVDLVGYLV